MLTSNMLQVVFIMEKAAGEKAARLLLSQRFLTLHMVGARAAAEEKTAPDWAVVRLCLCVSFYILLIFK